MGLRRPWVVWLFLEIKDSVSLFVAPVPSLMCGSYSHSLMHPCRKCQDKICILQRSSWQKCEEKLKSGQKCYAVQVGLVWVDGRTERRLPMGIESGTTTSHLELEYLRFGDWSAQQRGGRNQAKDQVTGIPGWRNGLAPAVGPGRDPGDPGSNPTSGSRCMGPASPSACVSASLCVSLWLS